MTDEKYTIIFRGSNFGNDSETLTSRKGVVKSNIFCYS